METDRSPIGKTTAVRADAAAFYLTASIFDGKMADLPLRRFHAFIAMAFLVARRQRVRETLRRARLYLQTGGTV